MANTPPDRIETISEFHRLRGLPQPEHPLISVINIDSITSAPAKNQPNWILDFYAISIKRSLNIKYKYGQQSYDFDEGVMFFMAPHQVSGISIGENATKPSGWVLLIHPDYLWNTGLAKTIKRYEYFAYWVNEALFLSPKEEALIDTLIQTIQQEYQANLDGFSQAIIISQLETLFNYAERFYHRQFITRKKGAHQLLDQLDRLLTAYFNSEELLQQGLPSVHSISEALHLSPNYLRSLLKVLTGQSTQQHIHNKLIERAKEHLSTTDRSISEIAYRLGFEHPQSFSKLFKTKTDLTPQAFRESFQ